MSTETKASKEEVAQQVFDMYDEFLYGRMNRLLNHYYQHGVMFSDTGKARLGSILGYILGLTHAGQKDFAVKLAYDFNHVLSYAACIYSEPMVLEFKEQSGDATITTEIKVPRRKLILYDDSTLHGFGVQAYAPVNLDFVEEVKRDFPMWRQELARRGIKDKYIDGDYSGITESKYIPTGRGRTVEVFYQPVFQGGLLYHGPGCGETFAVSLDKTFWSFHT
jgi:hypothetical protein